MGEVGEGEMSQKSLCTEPEISLVPFNTPLTAEYTN